MSLVRARIHLKVLDMERVVEADVESGETGVDGLLPLAQELIHAAIDAAEQQARAAGRTIRCSKGCSACCHQVVPIAPVEAVRLARLVEQMAEPRRSEVRRRFDAAMATMLEIGVGLGPPEYKLTGRVSADRTAWEDASTRYFDARIACPFLEDGACSIHDVRPLTCREYNVTSDPARCAKLDGGAEPVARPLQVVAALVSLGHEVDGTEPFSLPLVHALDWASQHALSANRRGEELFHRFVELVLAIDAATD